jgi:hypothetical protein
MVKFITVYPSKSIISIQTLHSVDFYLLKLRYYDVQKM